MTVWDELEDTLGWQTLVKEERERRDHLVRRLIALGRESSDPVVRGVAAEILTIEHLLLTPQRKREAASA